MRDRRRTRSVRWGAVAIVIVAGMGFLGWQMGGSFDGGTEEAIMGDPTQEGLREAIFAGGASGASRRRLS